MSTETKNEVKTRSRMTRSLRVAGCAVAALSVPALVLVFAILRPLDPAPYLETAPSGEMLDRSGTLLHAFLNPEQQWSFPRRLEGFSPYLVQATLAVEDQRFRRHPGVDPWAVLRACWQNLRRGGVASGASTITMQVVKLGGHAPESLGGKAEQMLLALRLERSTAKEAVLEAYLNKAPYGLNLVGAAAASRRYFGKAPDELTVGEAALLAGLPKAPSVLQPLAHPKRALARRNYVLERMRDEGFLSAEECARAMESPLGASWHEFPRLAPHLAMSLRSRIQSDSPLRVTLDAALQGRIERLAAHYLKRFDGEVTNAAIVVVDVGSASILARVGSADFFSTRGGGQVDLCRARRSPGSTLKPFTYGLAMERNRIYPSECLLDDTLDYGTYSPGNFDGEYSGLVSAAEALHYSLNVPAILTIERLGVDALHEHLRGLGLRSLDKAPEYYGLGLTLGNCELRLEELAGAYCALANLGVYHPLRVLADEPPAEGVRRLSRGTGLALYAMLEAPFPEEVDARMARSRGVQPRVCWKTGTSSGYHDAWTFAFNRQYVVAVWLGNNDGRPSKRLVGAQAALPLAGLVFRSLDPVSTPVWPETGCDLREVRVCAISGLPASPWCAATRSMRLPRKQFLHRCCDVHHPGEGGRVSERWPATARRWDLAQIREPVAADDAGDEQVALRIKMPVDKAEYVLTGQEQGDRIRLEASVEEQARLYWYLDDRYLGATGPDAPPLFLELATGPHHVVCMVPGGETDRVCFEVQPPARGVPFQAS